jgi:predicted esterase
MSEDLMRRASVEHAVNNYPSIRLALPLFSLLAALFLQPVAHARAEQDLPATISNEAFSMISEFLDYDRSLPLDVRIAESLELDDHSREKIVFTSVHDERVPGYLAIPSAGARPFPVVLFCHGGGGSKEGGWQENNYTGQIVRKLIASGYAVLALDAQHSGERLHNNDYEQAYKYIVERHWYKRERDMIFQTVIDWRRAIDYLSTRPEIDTERIGVDGFSFGSIVGYILSSVDDRVGVASLSGLPVGRRSYNWESRILRKHNYLNGIDGQAVLLQLGLDDNNILKEDAEQFFGLLESERKELIWYDSGHALPLEYQTRTLEWFEKHLKQEVRNR